MFDRAAKEIARPRRDMSVSRSPAGPRSIVVITLVAMFVGSAVLCVGLIAPMLWTVVTEKVVPTGSADDPVQQSQSRPKAALKPFGAILAGQIGNQGGDKPAK